MVMGCGCGSLPQQRKIRLLILGAGPSSGAQSLPGTSILGGRFQGKVQFHRQVGHSLVLVLPTLIAETVALKMCIRELFFFNLNDLNSVSLSFEVHFFCRQFKIWSFLSQSLTLQI